MRQGLTVLVAGALLSPALVPVAFGGSFSMRPLSFEPNEGQADPAITFLSRGSGYTLALAPTEARLALTPGSVVDNGRASAAADVLRITLLGANPSAVGSGIEPMPARSHYFRGGDPAKWRTNVAHYAKVRFREVYPGIDLVYYGNQGQLEYDWLVAPGAEPGAIRFAVEGAQADIDEAGDLVLATGAGAVRIRKPFVYQEQAGQRRAVAGAFARRNAHEFGFALAAYDQTRPLVIDPVLAYSTYLGGSSSEVATGIAVDGAGNSYVTGYTSSADFPVVGASPIQVEKAFGSDVFVAKLSAAGTLLYSTYLGGGDTDMGRAIAVDSSGNAYVTGETESVDFPTRNPRQPRHAGFTDAFVAKISPSGSVLIYSTFHGGSALDAGLAIAVDASRNAHITGETNSSNLPTFNGDPVPGGGLPDYRAFATKLDSAGTSLIYSRYLGDNDGESRGYGIALDPSGRAYVAGYAETAGFRHALAFQPARAGRSDAFVSLLGPTGNSLASTYLGGYNPDWATAIACDAWGNVYVTGQTSSQDFPLAGPLPMPVHGPYLRPFVAKLNPGLTALVYSTFLGGYHMDGPDGIAVDAVGNAYVAGYTTSADFPEVNAPLARPPLSTASLGNGFVTKIDRWASRLAYSTYLGGNNSDRARAIAVDASGAAHVAGSTASANFPVVAAFQGTNRAGETSAFVTKISEPLVQDVARLTVSPSAVQPGQTVTVTWAGVPNPAGSDWIGFYPAGTTPDDAGLPVVATGGVAAGSAPFAIPADTPYGATYELRLFGAGGARLATSNPFTVHPPSLKLHATAVSSGESLTASWSWVQNPSRGDWIGLYASPAAGDGSYVTYHFLNGLSSGTVTLTVPAGTATGFDYELRLHSGVTYTRLATSRRLTVLLPALAVSPSAVPHGGSVRATWSNVVNPAATDWIGLYISSSVPDSSPMRKQVTNGQATTTFLIPPLTPLGARYELRLFRGGSSPLRLATSNSFRVEQSELRALPYTVPPGGPVSAAWAYVPNATSGDWVGLYPSSTAGDRDYLTRRNIVALSAGIIPLTVPPSAIPGTTYELRLFRANTFSRLATSNPFAVAP